MSSLDPAPQDEEARATAPERRAFVRYASDLTAACQPANRHEGGWLAQVQDISAGGLGLFLRHRFRPGTPLWVELRRRDGVPLRSVRVRVVYVHPAQVEGQVGWRVGCAFATPLSGDELQSLLS